MRFPVLKVSEVLPCSETDALIHERVYMLVGEPWPYSTDDTLAKRIAEIFDIFVVQIYDSATLQPVHSKSGYTGPVCGYFGMQMVEPEGDVDLRPKGLASLAPADTYALAVIRSVLLILGLVEDDLSLYQSARVRCEPA